MDFDSVDRRPERWPVSGWRRPVEKLSLVDVNQLKMSGWSTLTSRTAQDGRRRPVEKRQDGDGRHRPVEKLSLVDIDQ